MAATMMEKWANRVQAKQEAGDVSFTPEETVEFQENMGASAQKIMELQKEFDALNHMLTHQPPSAWAKREKKYHDDKKAWDRMALESKSKIKRLNDEISLLKCDTRLVKLQEANQAIEDESEQTKKKFGGLESALEAAMTRATAAEGTLAKVQSEHEAALAEAVSMRRGMAKQNEVVQATKVEVEREKAKAMELARLLKTLQVSHNETTLKGEGLKEQVEGLKTKHEQSKISLLQSREQLARQVATLQVSGINSDETLALLRDQVLDLQKDVAALETANMQLVEEVQAARMSEAETLEVAKELDDEGNTRFHALQIELQSTTDALARALEANQYYQRSASIDGPNPPSKQLASKFSSSFSSFRTPPRPDGHAIASSYTAPLSASEDPTGKDPDATPNDLQSSVSLVATPGVSQVVTTLDKVGGDIVKPEDIITLRPKASSDQQRAEARALAAGFRADGSQYTELEISDLRRSVTDVVGCVDGLGEYWSKLSDEAFFVAFASSVTTGRTAVVTDDDIRVVTLSDVQMVELTGLSQPVGTPTARVNVNRVTFGRVKDEKFVPPNYNVCAVPFGAKAKSEGFGTLISHPSDPYTAMEMAKNPSVFDVSNDPNRRRVSMGAVSTGANSKSTGNLTALQPDVTLQTATRMKDYADVPNDSGTRALREYAAKQELTVDVQANQIMKLMRHLDQKDIEIASFEQEVNALRRGEATQLATPAAQILEAGANLFGMGRSKREVLEKSKSRHDLEAHVKVIEEQNKYYKMTEANAEVATRGAKLVAVPEAEDSPQQQSSENATLKQELAHLTAMVVQMKVDAAEESGDLMLAKRALSRALERSDYLRMRLEDVATGRVTVAALASAPLEPGAKTPTRGGAPKSPLGTMSFLNSPNGKDTSMMSTDGSPEQVAADGLARKVQQQAEESMATESVDAAARGLVDDEYRQVGMRGGVSETSETEFTGGQISPESGSGMDARSVGTAELTGEYDEGGVGSLQAVDADSDGDSGNR